jgi:hypothetical protein
MMAKGRVRIMRNKICRVLKMDGESATLLTKIDNDLKPYVIADVPKPRKNEAVITNSDTEASLAPFCAGCDREYGRNLARDKYLQNRVNACVQLGRQIARG